MRPQGETFDWRNPTLCAVYPRAEVIEIAKLWAKLVVPETIIRIVHRGKQAMDLLECICMRVDAIGEQALAQTGANDVAAAAYSDVKQMTTCIAMLLGKVAPRPQDLDAVFLAKHSGHKFNLKNALQQHPHFRQLETEARQRCVATLTMGPEVTAACTELADGRAPLNRACVIAKRVPVWREALVAGKDIHKKNNPK
eukprot:6474350-Amphidinium_carterae.2